MHCSDEELLAHLDGGLPAFGERRVSRHLKSCWRCRTRLSAYEKQIHRLATAMDEWPFPEPEWTKDAKHRLNQSLRQFESEFSEPRSRDFGVWAVRGSVAAAALILTAGLGFLWMQYFQPRLRPADVIAHATTVERALYRQSVHQTFSIQIAQVRPVQKAINTQLEVWCDRDSGKFASRLIETGGGLKHALWRPSADAEFLYRPALSQSVTRQSPHQAMPVSLVSLADYGLEPEQLESGFMRWLEGRSWTAISFASDISVWSAEDGTVVKAERVPGDSSGPAVRITAERKSRRMVVILTVDVDSSTYRPRIQKLRFETPERAVEVRLAATNIRPVRPAEVASSAFPPELRVGTDRQVAIPLRDRIPAIPPDPARNAVDAGPASPEIEAHFALHKAGACLGQAVRVSEDSGGTRIWKLADASGGEIEGFTTSAGIAHVLGALSDLRRTQSAPVQFEQAPQPLVAALRHAWAIQQLAADFPHQRTQGMSVSSRRLLATMLREHIASARKAYSELGLAVSPSADRRPGDSDWRRSTSVLLESLTRLGQVLQLQPPGDDLQQLSATVDTRMRWIADGISVEAREVGAGLSARRRPR